MLHYRVVVLVLVIVNSLRCTVQTNDTNSTTVKLVNVLFRQGGRTNDVPHTYPNDPHINETYYPYGLGQLTSRGKQREYTLGKALRKRYSNFLEDLYIPEVLNAITTNKARTKMSLQLVLAGLYPPKHTALDWDSELDWQPIPYSYVPYEQDRVLTLPIFVCPNYKKEYGAYLRSPNGLAIQQKYTELYEYLTLHTGRKISSTFDISMLYIQLVTQQEWGLELPPWTTSVFPKSLEAATIDQYLVYSATTKLKQLSGGFLVKQMIKNMQLKVNNKLKPENRKLYLYSGHELNIAHVLNALEVYFPHVPPYGSYVLVELHEINGIYGVKIFYQDYSSVEPKPLTIPGCDHFCHFTRFVSTLHENLPANEIDPCVF